MLLHEWALRGGRVNSSTCHLVCFVCRGTLVVEPLIGATEIPWIGASFWAVDRSIDEHGQRCPICFQPNLEWSVGTLVTAVPLMTANSQPLRTDLSCCFSLAKRCRVVLDAGRSKRPTAEALRSMDVSKLIVIWPNNVDSTRTIKKGRRIPKASGCERPRRSGPGGCPCIVVDLC